MFQRYEVLRADDEQLGERRDKSACWCVQRKAGAFSEEISPLAELRGIVAAGIREAHHGVIPELPGRRPGKHADAGYGVSHRTCPFVAARPQH